MFSRTDLVAFATTSTSTTIDITTITIISRKKNGRIKTHIISGGTPTRNRRRSLSSGICFKIYGPLYIVCAYKRVSNRTGGGVLIRGRWRGDSGRTSSSSRI